MPDSRTARATTARKRECFRPASQHKVADRSAAKHPGRELRADTNTGAELFVSRFQPRGDVNRVAIGRVIEEPASAEIADNCWPGVGSNPRSSTRYAFFPPPVAKVLRILVQSQSAGHSLIAVGTGALLEADPAPAGCRPLRFITSRDA